jgi:hypothetical protein
MYTVYRRNFRNKVRVYRATFSFIKDPEPKRPEKRPDPDQDPKKNHSGSATLLKFLSCADEPE